MDDEMFERFARHLVAKWGKDENRYHLLIYHLLDSAAASLVMWDEALSESVRRQVAGWLGISMDESRNYLAYWCALHDIGKASPAFQKKNKTQQAYAQAQGYLFQGAMESDHHGMVGGKLVKDHALAPRLVAVAISGHHGTWNLTGDISEKSVGRGLWQDYRAALVERLRNLLQVGEPPNLDLLPDDTGNLFTVWVSGWISVVDWVASNKEPEEYRQDVVAFDQYFPSAVQNARKKLAWLGWLGWRAAGAPVSFAAMYPKLMAARNIQTEVISETINGIQPGPFLLILEAMTGIGKTEIALYLADWWLQQQGGSGLYVALPTMATSNQMYERATDIFYNRYPQDLLSFVLAHGQAAWSKEVNNFLVRGVNADRTEGVIVSDWFQSNKKRALLTPFGVGTVDQSLMAILQTRHFFVRMFGMAGKVVIFDEVHAYDSYMRELFANLLGWLRRLGAVVIILSATLPDDFRRELVTAYSGGDSRPEADVSYPRMTLSQPGSPPRVVNLRPTVQEKENREVTIGWERPADLVKVLKERLRDGGCAAVICNTVRGAQGVYEQICQAVEEEELDPLEAILFHAGFPQAWRKEREEAVLGKFGKGKDGKVENPCRPPRAVVVATQVIEQSLDLDFDLILSEFAPVDLLLQRAGRLHRHERKRLPALVEPTLILFEPELGAGGSPKFGGSEWVYDRAVLLSSYLALRYADPVIHSVTDTRRLIEQVYGNNPLPPQAEPFRDEIARLRNEFEDRLTEKKRKAQVGMISDPGDRNLTYASFNQLNDEENPAVHRAYQALTRDIDSLSLRIVCVHQQDGQLYLNPDCTGAPLDLARLKTRDERLAEIFGQSLSIQRNDVVLYLLEEGSVYLRQAKHVAALRYVYFMEFTGGVCETPGYRFLLDKKLGLRIEKVH